MRIHHLTLQNFKLFEHREFRFHPQFNLLVGENGTGKTSVLDGLAVALAIWLVNPPDTSLNGSKRNILESEIRILPTQRGDRLQFQQMRPVRVEAIGDLDGTKDIRWARQIRMGGSRTTNLAAQEATGLIQQLYKRDAAGERLTLPILANYGAGRAWLPSNQRENRPALAPPPARRWDAFYDCFSERVRSTDLREWFAREAVAAGARGRPRPGFLAVRQAIIRCLPGATDLWYDADRVDLVAEIDGEPSPFVNLSAGQRVLLAMVGDIAIRAVTQNAHLLPDDGSVDAGDTLSRVLAETPGVVLIDELDVHLHPKWQRRVQMDLTHTFPAIQFICTSHSPFIIQALEPGQLVPLQEDFEPVEYAGKPLSDIAETVQHVDTPDRSLAEEKLALATERYFELLRTPRVAAEELHRAEAEYRQASEPFTEHPGLNAILKLQALAAGKENTL